MQLTFVAVTYLLLLSCVSVFGGDWPHFVQNVEAVEPPESKPVNEALKNCELKCFTDFLNER